MVIAEAPGGLSTLPEELLLQILEILPGQRDLYSMCLVSRHLNKVTDPVLYKSLAFDTPKHHLTFFESLLRKPRRGSLIQNVRLQYPSSEFDFMCLMDDQMRIDTFSHTISTMSNLENLEVTVPAALCHGIGTLFNGPFDLACLKSCSLFYQFEGGGYWDLQENIHIFGHPTLEKLTIRRAKLDVRGFESLEKPSETGLVELHLIECDINDDALGDILLLPEALKEFTMTQLESPCPPLEESSDDIEDYIVALRSAQHSLETVSINFPTLGSENALRLRDFDVLQSLELRDYQLFGQSTPRLNSVGLPSMLESLTFLNPISEDEEIQELLCYLIENKTIVARKWEHLVIAEGKEEPPAKVIEACTKSGLQLGIAIDEG